jgi:6-aminohexanoate-oligomer endohydrolase
MNVEPRANDRESLTLRTDFDGPVVTFDLPGLEIGVAEYEEGPTGCTVFHFPAGAACAVDVRGGSPGTIGNYEWVHAVVFAGGSLFGLEAAVGVTAELHARRGYSTAWGDIPLVSGAIVYDFGPRWPNAIYPDKELGRAALRAARAGAFPLGARGAGRSVSVGKTFDFEQAEPAGQGCAYGELGGTKLAVFTVVNSVGAIVDREGKVMLGYLGSEGERLPLVEELERRIESGEPTSPDRGNTTLTLVATNQVFDRRALQQMARQVHASMARAIQPFHTLYDGDVLYAITTGDVDNADLDPVALGVLASELAWDAVLSVAQR